MSSDPLISVITPTHKPEAPYLGEAYKGLCEQEINWEWIIQFDGPEWDPPAYLLTDPRIKIECNGKHLGVAITRNRAAGRARAELLQIHDADDVLLPGTLEVLSSTLIKTGAAYATGRVKHLVNGQIVEKYAHGRVAVPKVPFGEVAPGALADYWFQYDRMPFATNSMMWQRKIFLAAGGQSALEAGEDADMALSVSEHYPGQFLNYYTIIYRAHDESMMHKPNFFTVIRPRNHIFIAQHIRAIRQLDYPERKIIDKIQEVESQQSSEIISLRTNPAAGERGLISVITATHDPEAPYLREAYESLLQQESVKWEWLLQFDGLEWQLPQWLADDPRVHFASNGSSLGVAMTRNQALLRSRGEFIQNLDSDDQLLPGALARVAKELSDNPELAYALGRVHHLIGDKFSEEDDSGRVAAVKLPIGEIQPGTIYEYMKEHDRMPFSLNCLMYRRLILFSKGGWTALSVGEDSCLFLAVSEDYRGKIIKDFTLIYRQHPLSLMHNHAYWTIDRPLAKEFSTDRLEAIRTIKTKLV